MYLKITPLFCIAVLLFLCSSPTLHAQMFSVGNVQTNTTPDAPSNNIMVFYDFTDFTYFGPGFSNAPDFNYDFDKPLLRIQYESPLLNIYASFGRNLGPEENVNFTQVGIGLQAMYTFSRAESFRVYMPLSINTDYTLARTEETQNTSNEFAQNSAYIGAGLGFQTRFNKRLRLDLKALPHIGYTSGSFGASGGASWKTNLTGRFYMDNLVSGLGLSFGYDFKFTSYDNTNNDLKYEMQSSGFSLGITF